MSDNNEQNQQQNQAAEIPTNEAMESTSGSSDTAKIAELEAKNLELNDKLLRLAAELENTRRRHRDELEKSSKFAISNFVNDLVIVTEHFFLACDNAPQQEIEQNANFKNFADAITMTKKEMMKVLEKNRVTRIYPLNQKFDHNLHEAISQAESDADEGTVLQVIQAGYSIADRLIRPALVSVAKAKS